MRFLGSLEADVLKEPAEMMDGSRDSGRVAFVGVFDTTEVFRDSGKGVRLGVLETTDVLRDSGRAKSAGSVVRLETEDDFRLVVLCSAECQDASELAFVLW